MNASLVAIMSVPRMNLTLAWVWLLFGFLSGLGLGLCFHRENWLGGYGSFQRRLYRLAHISFFGLGFVNLGFYFTARVLPGPQPLLSLASLSFVVGAVMMPFCCLLMAHSPRTRMLFAVPVLSLLLGGGLTTFMLLHQGPNPLASAL
jgi:hypothetical protein